MIEPQALRHRKKRGGRWKTEGEEEGRKEGSKEETENPKGKKEERGLEKRQMKKEGEKGEGKAEEEMEGCNFEDESIPLAIGLPLAESRTRQAGGSRAQICLLVPELALHTHLLPAAQHPELLK